MNMISWALVARAACFLCNFKVGNANILSKNMFSTTTLMRNLGMRPKSPRGGGITSLGLGFVHAVPQCHSITSRFLSNKSDVDSHPITSVAIIGGGLAGLSAAYHLLDITGKKVDGNPRELQITIFDKAPVGEGGASSVAGGLIHPFSPVGKLIHFGLSALDESNNLIHTASKHQPQCIIRNNLYRIALRTKNVIQLKDTAKKYPHLATWMTKKKMQDKFGLDSLGGLELGHGCKVIHVPSYLRGLWEECEMKAKYINGSVNWELIENGNGSMNLGQYDAIILSAGAAIIHDQLIRADNLPAQQVRGQSVEMTLPASEDSGKLKDAFLCGKYVSPLPTKTTTSGPSSQRFVIGATHEFKDEPLNEDEVMKELKDRTYSLAKDLWDRGTADKLTTGIRLQSNRGAFGRMPIIGRYNTTSQDATSHQNTWIFTGLSSRGIIYHGLFGRWLASAVLNDNEDELRGQFPEFDWWHKKTKP